MAVVRKMLEILVSTSRTSAEGVDTMMMPELPLGAATGRATRNRSSLYRPLISPVARSDPWVRTFFR